jgi:hypothetical protein
MTDKHLFNAFNLTKDETLFQEMWAARGEGCGEGG